MIQRQWRHWLHFVPEVHLSEWFCFLNSQNGHPAQSNALLEHAKLTNRPNILFHHKAYIFFPIILWFPYCFVFRSQKNDGTWLQSERVRRRARSKLQREAKCLLNLLFPSFSGGESTWAHMKKWSIFFNVFEISFFMKKHHFWRVVKDQSLGLASYARPPAQSNAMLRQRTTLQVRRNVQQLPSKDEERTLHFLDDQVQNRILLLKPLNRSKFHPESACFTASATKTCAHVIGKHVHVIGHVLRRLSCWPM